MPRKSRAPRYPQTQALVRIALRQGMTQTEIGKACRDANQSTVSKWAAGNLLSDRDTLRPLIARFGHLLERKPFRLYHRGGDSAARFLKVEGKTILRERFAAPSGDGRCTALRLSVQVLEDAHFALAVEWTGNPSPQQAKARQGAAPDYTHRQAIWQLLDFKPLVYDLPALISKADELSAQGMHIKDGASNPILLRSFARLLREALLSHGHTVEDVEILRGPL